MRLWRRKKDTRTEAEVLASIRALMGLGPEVTDEELKQRIMDLQRAAAGAGVSAKEAAQNLAAFQRSIAGTDRMARY